MDLSRLRTGELIAGVSGVALLVVMFLPWFGLPDVVADPLEQFSGIDTTVNAWEAFDFIDLVLMLAVISGVGLAVLAAAQPNVQLPVAASAITAGIGILGAVFVIYRVLDPILVGADREIGLYLGLVAVVGIAIGGWMAMQEEGTTFGDEADQLSSR
jgi:hypothetical protein